MRSYSRKIVKNLEMDIIEKPLLRQHIAPLPNNEKKESTMLQIFNEPAVVESLVRDNELNLEIYTKNVSFLRQIIVKHAKDNLEPTQTLLTVKEFKNLLAPKQIYTLLRDTRLQEHAELFKFYLTITSKLSPPKLVLLTGDKVKISIRNILEFMIEQNELGNDNPVQDDKINCYLMRQFKFVVENQDALKRVVLEFAVSEFKSK